MMERDVEEREETEVSTIFQVVMCNDHDRLSLHHLTIIHTKEGGGSLIIIKLILIFTFLSIAK